jgi:hypothetical protein
MRISKRYDQTFTAQLPQNKKENREHISSAEASGYLVSLLLQTAFFLIFTWHGLGSL